MTSQEVALETALRILADQQNRETIWCLEEETTDGVASYDELIKYIDSHYSEDQDQEEVRVQLHHVILPTLEDANLVEFDPRAETVRYRPDPLVTDILESTEQWDDNEREMLDKPVDDTAQAIHTVETQQTLRRYRTAVEAVPDGVFILDEDGTIELANQSVASLLGMTIDEIHGQPFTTFVEAGVFDETIIEWYLESVRTMLSSENDCEEVRYETEIRPTNAPPRLVEAHLALRSSDDGFRGTVGVVRDVTEQRTRERRLATLVDNLPGIVYRCKNDQGWPMEYVKGEVEELTGYSPDTFSQDEGHFGTHLIHPDDRGEVWTAVQTALDEQESYEIEYRILTKAGETKWVWERGQGVYPDDDRVEALEGFITEITDRKRRQQELQRQNERLRKFANILSHDLRNPLNVAQARIQLAQQTQEIEHLDDARRGLNRAFELIDDLLTVAQQEQAISDTEFINLEEIANECWKNVKTPDAQLVTDCDQSIQADPGQLKRLLENLIRNAIEHGGADVTVTIGDLDRGFYVADDGAGIPQEDRKKVFEPAYTSNTKEAGFGLDIIRRITEAHGWEITVTESEAGGARFEITFGSRQNQ
ncbi:PAS domain-containing sensor histidine kinase [Natrarchaeobius chitinivorans]|uniref:histidine kinase n=1 Tax=Natrarchaeobius chitinivorans TaxID=1679083 RepID=A0A3N6LQS3_NATCH|nr:PAS domain S-box protein [Natrarchaeobius chitinivorans]RQG91988.1 PAS domain S-box protein [Natrarchaeobius chitinivorans]